MEHGMAYVARAIWSRSFRSSPGQGKPATWRREAGQSVLINCGGSRMALARQFIETVHEVGKKGHNLERVYQRMQNRELFLLAYGMARK